MRSAFSLQVSATVVLCHVKLMSGVLSLEVREQMLCSGLCNSAARSIVYLFISFLGSDVNVETRCIVHGVNIHILICTLNVRETSDDWPTGIFNISCTSRGNAVKQAGVILAIMISNLLLWNHSQHSCTEF